jgi:hypothetical protein
MKKVPGEKDDQAGRNSGKEKSTTGNPTISSGNF